MPDEPKAVPSLPVYPTPRGVMLPPDAKFQKPFMKAIKAHLKPKMPKPRQRKIKDDVKWW